MWTTRRHVALFALFMRSTLVPLRDTVSATLPTAGGSTLFNQIGCAVCRPHHRDPQPGTPSTAARRGLRSRSATRSSIRSAIFGTGARATRPGVFRFRHDRIRAVHAWRSAPSSSSAGAGRGRSAVYLWRRPRPYTAGFEREPDPVVSPPESPTPVPAPVPARSPQAAEVQPVLDRVFDGTVVVDGALQPAFVAGDLNGDDITDLAVAVRPRGDDMLGTLNAALTRWRRLDATDPSAPPGAPPKPAPVEIARNDLLLAVIHGEGAGAWRDPIATQGYLVKNALGTGLRLRPLMEVPDEVRERVIRAQGRRDRPGARGPDGVVFWTGAAYAWGDVRPANRAGGKAAQRR
jgi:hypothetical protein